MYGERNNKGRFEKSQLRVYVAEKQKNNKNNNKKTESSLNVKNQSSESEYYVIN